MKQRCNPALPGAQEKFATEPKQRGIKAAEAVFERAGITALQAAEGMFALEGWDHAGFPEGDNDLTEEEDDAATIWMYANKAAINACCAGWSADQIPAHPVLELVD